MKLVLSLVGLAGFCSLVLVNAVLWARNDALEAALQARTEQTREVYQIAVEQNDALEECVVRINDCVETDRQLRRCQGLK